MIPTELMVIFRVTLTYHPNRTRTRIRTRPRPRIRPQTSSSHCLFDSHQMTPQSRKSHSFSSKSLHQSSWHPSSCHLLLHHLILPPHRIPFTHRSHHMTSCLCLLIPLTTYHVCVSRTISPQHDSLLSQSIVEHPPRGRVALVILTLNRHSEAPDRPNPARSFARSPWGPFPLPFRDVLVLSRVLGVNWQNIEYGDD